MNSNRALTDTLVDEVNADTVQFGAEVVEPVQLAFLCPPVELAGPVSDQLPQVAEVGALRPGGHRCRIGPPRVADAGPQVRQNLVADPDREGFDRQAWARLAHHDLDRTRADHRDRRREAVGSVAITTEPTAGELRPAPDRVLPGARQDLEDLTSMCLG